MHQAHPVLTVCGFTGGGQIGYNFQPSNWVWGIEADIQSLDLSDSHGGKFRYTTNNAPYNLSISNATDWLFTLRGSSWLRLQPLEGSSI